MVHLAKHRDKRRRYYLWQIKERLQAQWAGIKLTLKDITLEVLDIVNHLRHK